VCVTDNEHLACKDTPSIWYERTKNRSRGNDKRKEKANGGTMFKRLRLK
jgi:hypothetical protein